MTTISVRRLAGPAMGAITTLLMWELIGRSQMFGEVWPPLTAVLGSAVVESPGREVLLHGAAATLPDAARGLAVGMVVGSLLALVGGMVPVLARGLGQVAVFIQAVPVIAITPVLLTTIDRVAIPSTLAAIGASFAAFVSVTAGLSSTLALHHDLFRVLGAARLARLRYLEGPACIPFVLEGLRFAVPGAMVGAIVGEWFEATRGLGVVMLQTMRSGDMEMLLGAALVAALASLATFGAVATVERLCSWELT